MVKINTSKQTLDNFYDSIKKLFLNDLKKIKKNKLAFKISYIDIEKLILKKLKLYDKDISFEKLIKADYNYMKNLVAFIDKHPHRYKLTRKQKDYFLTMYERLKKPHFIKQLNINVCPYCNRNYIFNFSKNNEQEATAQLDHFFDKKDYPYLAVSMFNLIPSCSTCNQRKSSKKADIFHPYTESFNESAKFKYKGIQAIDNKSEITFLDSKRVVLKIEPTNHIKKVEEHIEVFNLENLYNEHKDIVSELLQKREIYSDSYIEELLKQYGQTVFKSRDDLLRLITCGYINDEDLNKRPLSKLIKDISKELDLT